MTTRQLKSEIQKVLDSVPDEVLKDILSYLREIQKRPADQIQMSRRLKQILDVDTELLKKLAQ